MKKGGRRRHHTAYGSTGYQRRSSLLPPTRGRFTASDGGSTVSEAERLSAASRGEGGREEKESVPYRIQLQTASAAGAESTVESHLILQRAQTYPQGSSRDRREECYGPRTCGTGRSR